jgi:hypothetical protein
MAAMFGVAAVADLPLSLRHIDSASAKSTFRTLAFETANIRLAIESAGVMQGLNDRRDALERPHAVKNYKLELYLLQAGQAVGGTGTEVFLIAQSGACLTSRLASCTSTVRTSVKPSSHIIRFPLATSPQALATPAAARSISGGQTSGRYPGTGCIDAPRANRASAEDELPRVLGRPDVQPQRRMRRYHAWTDSRRSIVACT